MAQPDELPAVLDIAKAERMFRAYRRGQMARPILRYRLIDECGIPEDSVEEGIRGYERMTLAELDEQERQDTAAGKTTKPIIIERRSRGPILP